MNEIEVDLKKLKDADESERIFVVWFTLYVLLAFPQYVILLMGVFTTDSGTSGGLPIALFLVTPSLIPLVYVYVKKKTKLIIISVIISVILVDIGTFTTGGTSITSTIVNNREKANEKYIEDNHPRKDTTKKLILDKGYDEGLVNMQWYISEDTGILNYSHLIEVADS